MHSYIKLSPEVKAAGGLAIIGTERHESRRVDRQLRGRAGRQGDPGKIMASNPITSWQIDGDTVKRVTDFIFLGSQITAHDDCSNGIKRRLLPGRKAT